MKDPAVQKCVMHIEQARAAIRRAWDALDGIEDPRQRAEYEELILNLGSERQEVIAREGSRR